jgi:hypothetical protein
MTTIERFKLHEEFIKKNMNLDQAQYNLVRSITIAMMGEFRQDKTYCGPGKVGDLIVPDLCFSWAGYVHDGLCKYIVGTKNRKGVLAILNKKFVDDVFYYMMLSTCSKCKKPYRFLCGNILAFVYYKAVDIFGIYSHNPNALNEE